MERYVLSTMKPFNVAWILDLALQKKDKVRIDFTHDELYTFYSKVCQSKDHPPPFLHFSANLSHAHTSWKQYKNN